MFGLFESKKRRAVKFTAQTADGKQKVKATVDVSFSDSMPHSQIKKQIARKLERAGYPALNVSTMEIIDMWLI